MDRRQLVTIASLLLLLLAAAAPARSAPEGASRVVGGLELPVSLAFAPDGRLFVAEQHRGTIRLVRDGRLRPAPVARLEVLGTFEQGLLGIALHPEFPEEPWLYAYLSDPDRRINRLVRMRLVGDRAGPPQPLLDLLPVEAGYHNGGDLAFGPDGMLYVTVGDVHDPGRAQDPGDLGGKVLRLAPDGSIPEDNPLGPDSPVYSLGHRNSFGICADPSTGTLWETENGPSSHDEVNRLRPGANFGWPDQLGPGGRGRGFVDPVLDFPEQIVPTGCAVWGGDLYFGAYRDGMVRRLALPAGAAAEARPVARLEAGITDLAVGPDGRLYVAALDGVHRLTDRPAVLAPADVARGGSRIGWIVVGAGAAIALAAVLAAARRAG